MKSPLTTKPSRIPAIHCLPKVRKSATPGNRIFGAEKDCWKEKCGPFGGDLKPSQPPRPNLSDHRNQGSVCHPGIPIPSMCRSMLVRFNPCVVQLSRSERAAKNMQDKKEAVTTLLRNNPYNVVVRRSCQKLLFLCSLFGLFSSHMYRQYGGLKQ